MPLYRCFIHGENFPGSILGESQPIGFYTTRFVVAATPDEAETVALALLKADESLVVPESERTSDARVYFEGIEEVSDDTDQVPGSGFTFYTAEA
ncbi:MAG: hypothetical protein EON58_22280 [Alphaproteobacteria bacterium]|nr:MAG: hypothetical protein EON58_22280 [Alphaproteobacteria bacterium]